MGPTWGLPGSCRPQVGPMLAPWTLPSGNVIWNASNLETNTPQVPNFCFLHYSRPLQWLDHFLSVLWKMITVSAVSCFLFDYNWNESGCPLAFMITIKFLDTKDALIQYAWLVLWVPYLVELLLIEKMELYPQLIFCCWINMAVDDYIVIFLCCSLPCSCRHLPSALQYKANL